MFTWSLGCTGFLSGSGRRRAFRSPGWRSPRWRSCCSTCPSRSETRRSGNSPSNFPSATSRQAASSFSTCSSVSLFLPVLVSLPRSRLADAAGHLHQAQRMNRGRRQRPAGDGKVLDGPLGLRAVIGLGGNLHVAHGVFFDAKFGHGHSQGWNSGNESPIGNVPSGGWAFVGLISSESQPNVIKARSRPEILLPDRTAPQPAA